MTISNYGKHVVRYEVHNVASLTVAPYNTTQQGYAPLQPTQYTQMPATANLKFSDTVVTIQPGDSVSISVGVDWVNPSIENQPFPIFGGSIQLDPLPVEGRISSKSLRIPYVGIDGDVSQLPMFDQGYPGLTTPTEILSAEGNEGNGTETTYVLDRSSPASDSIVVLYRLITGTAHMVAEVLNEDRQLLGIAGTLDYLARNTMDPDNYVSSSVWNGTIVVPGTGSMENIALQKGTYHLRWKALKLLADPELPGSWEISPPITVAITN